MIVKKMKNYGELTANYVSGSKSPWLITSWHAKGISTGTALLVLPPFYEEMNCCRRLFSSLAWQLTIEGIDTYLPDFYGTGDSSGDFSEISLDLWRRDLLMWLPTLSKYREVHLLGCRLGAALLLDWLVDFKQEVSVGKLLLWQPTLQVDRFWQQLTRQSKFSKNGTLSSKYLEVAGYIIPILLRAELGNLNTTLPSEIKDVLWLESSLNGSLNTAALNALKLNPNLDIRRITCAPYWLTQEVIDTDDLIPASLSFLTEPLPKNESNISNLCKVVLG